MKSVFDEFIAKINDKVERSVHQAQVGQPLGFVHGVKFFNTFHFNDNFPVDDEIKDEWLFYRVPFIADRNGDLSFCGEAA